MNSSSTTSFDLRAFLHDPRRIPPETERRPLLEGTQPPPVREIPAFNLRSFLGLPDSQGNRSAKAVVARPGPRHWPESGTREVIGVRHAF